MKSYFLAMVCTGAGLSALALVYLALLPLLGKRYGPRGLYRVWVVVLAGLLIPFSRYALVSRLHAMGGVLEQRHGEEGVEIRMRITPQNVKFACREGAKVLGGEKM